MELRWEETRDILRQLEGVYQSEDSDMVASIAQLAAEIQGVLRASQLDVRSSIRELAKQVHGDDSKEASVDRLADGSKSAIAAHTASMSQLQRVGGKELQAVQALRHEEQALTSDILDVEAADAATAAEAHRLEEARAADIPRVKHSLSLYCNISNIRWDTESRNVTGCILPPDGGPMKAFDMDPTRASEFQIANRLWDIIAASQ